jgi:hypothetical protein
VADLSLGSITSSVSSSIGDLASKLLPGKTAPSGSDTCKLLVNGKVYEGWQSIQVKAVDQGHLRSLLAGGRGQVGRGEGRLAACPWRLVQDPDRKDTVLTGYVDSVSPKFDASSRTFAVSGRDKAGDLVDCSIEGQPAQWVNLSMLQIARSWRSPSAWE